MRDDVSWCPRRVGRLQLQQSIEVSSARSRRRPNWRRRRCTASSCRLHAAIFSLDRLIPRPENDAPDYTVRGRMTRISRRGFIKLAAANGAAAGWVAARVPTLRANPLSLPIGSQTYPHRAMIKDGKVAELATMLADIGVQRVEMCSPLGYADFASLTDGRQVKKILADHGLKAESG